MLFDVASAHTAMAPHGHLPFVRVGLSLFFRQNARILRLTGLGDRVVFVIFAMSHAAQLAELAHLRDTVPKSALLIGAGGHLIARFDLVRVAPGGGVRVFVAFAAPQ